MMASVPATFKIDFQVGSLFVDYTLTLEYSNILGQKLTTSALLALSIFDLKPWH